MKRTPLFEKHLSQNARMVEFAGWEMPVQYPTGIVVEHLQTRKSAGLFDISHMGRFTVSGAGGLSFLQKALTNNAAALEPGRAQYTMIGNESGGAIDDAYLYCLQEQNYLLVVNAVNRDKDWDHLQRILPDFSGVECRDSTDELAMLSLQGPRSRSIVLEVLGDEALPEPGRNNLTSLVWNGKDLHVARSGYTGEPLGFEVFVYTDQAQELWDALMQAGAVGIGLGARDTLRLEAGLPLYGHELGSDPEGGEIPIFSCLLARIAVSFSSLKGQYIGREPLLRQFAAYRRIVKRDYSDLEALPRVAHCFTLLDKGIARQGAAVFCGERQIGWVTSGTMAPYWIFEGDGLGSEVTERSDRRAIGIALLDSTVEEETEIEIDVRGKRLRALTVPYLLRAEAPPYARPIFFEQEQVAQEAGKGRAAGAAKVPAPPPHYTEKARALLSRSIENNRWRQERCINLIPSEMTHSSFTRLLSIMDPSFRYAEHRKVKALKDAEVFYYQGTGFIAEVERELIGEFCKYLGCAVAETRLVSGQMANMAVFSALVDYLNRDNRRSEARRIRSVMNNHIIKGGHLSAQPMGALRDFVARNPETETAAVVNFPVCAEDPYRIDLLALPELLERHRPELIILGKSMILYREPVREVRRLVDELSLDTVIMYDMAHVIGLAGPHFQEPFVEGADIVTGSTHKTFFGTQRGVVAADWRESEHRYELWETIERRAFPGSVSNHHLGTLLGLLMATYEMNAFKDPYQKAVVANAKAFARALKDTGLTVAGDPRSGYTETHQVVVEVGYCEGVDAARRLEENNIIVNFQAAPREEGFTAAGALRMGVAEMTRFGMQAEDFRVLAGLIREVVLEDKNVEEEVAGLRERFRDLRFCFSAADLEGYVEKLQRLI